MTKAIQVRELGHIVLYVRDLGVSVNFYEQVLGWNKLSTPTHMPAVAFSSGRTHHELLLIEVGTHGQPKPTNLTLGLYHFGLKIGDSDEDLKRAVVALQKAGVAIQGATDHTVTHSLYITDPDGNEIELYIDVPGADWKNDPSLFSSPPKPLDLS